MRRTVGRFGLNRLIALTDSRAKAEAIRTIFGAAFELDCIVPEQMKDTAPDENLLVDICLGDDELFVELRDWLKLRTRRRSLVFMTDAASPSDSIRSAELGATDIIQRPLDRKAIFTALLGDFDSLLLDTSAPPIRSYPAMGPAIDALENIFAAARFGGALELPAIHHANETILERIRSQGLESWLDIVRRHHSETYQHSLIVVGVTAAFCQRLGFSREEQGALTLGALFHDLGKVHVPVAILEKPSALDAEEMMEMRKHPRYGFESLRNAAGIASDILEMVLHHHELLDGSGYPDQLPSNRIADAVRIITVCDIFAALIGRRSYKPTMHTEAAFTEMRAMGCKLDADILREFSFAAKLRLAA